MYDCLLSPGLANRVTAVSRRESGGLDTHDYRSDTENVILFARPIYTWLLVYYITCVRAGDAIQHLYPQISIQCAVSAPGCSARDVCYQLLQTGCLKLSFFKCV